MPDILAELNALKADHAASLALLEEAKASHETFKASLAEKEKEAVALTEAATSKDKEIAALKAQIAALQAKEQSAEAKAVDIVANQGINPLKVDAKAQAESVSKADVLATWAAIQDPKAKAEYYFAHKDAIYGSGGK